jgi:hypothetical protein
MHNIKLGSNRNEKVQTIVESLNHLLLLNWFPCGKLLNINYSDWSRAISDAIQWFSVQHNIPTCSYIYPYRVYVLNVTLSHSYRWLSHKPYDATHFLTFSPHFSFRCIIWTHSSSTSTDDSYLPIDGA